MRLIRSNLLLLFLLAAAAPLAAQQPARQRPPAAERDTTPKTPRERALERLRSLDRLLPPDTGAVAEVVDTTPAISRVDRKPAPSIPLDSIAKELTQLPGYTVTEYSGEEATFSSDSSKLVLRGTPKVAQEGQALGADSLVVYDQVTDIACAYGKPVLSGVGQAAPVQSDQVCYNVGDRTGVAVGAVTTFNEGATTWFIRGDVYPVGTNELYAHKAIFTDCDLTVPHYHFAASRVKFVKNDVMVARNVTLTFGDVPVFWLPFMMQSLKQGRRSGLLTPRFSINDIARTNAGYNRRIEDVGLYWAINENLGAEAALDWFSNNYIAYRGSFDYRFTRQFLQGGLTFKQYNPQDGAKVLTIAGNNSWQPDERTSVSLNANFASSSRFIKQRSFDPRELTQSITSTAGMQHRFDWGSISMQADRKQRLSDNQVDMTLPSFTLNLSPLTLLKAPPTQSSFYNNISVTSNLVARNAALNVQESVATPQLRDTRTRNAQFSGSINMGSLSLQQTASYDQRRDLERAALDTLPALPALSDEHVQWSTSLNFQQRLIGTSTFTPRLALRGEWIRRDSAQGPISASAPLRLDFGADLRTDLYAFFPGFGPVTRIRHRFSPTFSYAYSPQPAITDIQRRVFGVGVGRGIRQQNQLSIGLNQTFEAKLRGTATPQDSASQQDSTTATLDSPRRLPQARKIMLLSLNTSAVAYDFVVVPDSLRSRIGRDRYGVTSTSLTNSINSDLLRGLQLSLQHEIFRSQTSSTGVETREFKPHLASVNASFSLNGESWLFRTLGLRGKAVEKPAPDTARTDPTRPQGGPESSTVTGLGLGLIGRQRDVPVPAASPAGSWSGSFTYTLLRPRNDPGAISPQQANQLLQGSMDFTPTQHWRVHWTTSYNFTEKEFSDHVLTLTRDLHDWEAHFDFVRAQNGNFSFQFRVNLRANPDIKFDYEQRDRVTNQFNP